MSGKLIEVYHADDNEHGGKFRRFTEDLLSYFHMDRPVLKIGSQEITDIEKGIERLSEYLLYRPSASRYDAHEDHLDDVIEHIESVRRLPDINIVDMRWRHDKGHVEDDAGVDIIEKILDRNQQVCVYTNTAFPDETLQKIVGLAQNYQVDTIGHNQVEHDLKEKLPKAFRRTAERYLKKADSEEKIELLKRVDNLSEDELLETVIQVNGNSWKVKNLFLCFWNPDKGKYEGLEGIRDLVTTDLTLAFSRAFGIWGLKELTHANQDIYLSDNEDTILKIADTQLRELRETVDDVPDNVLCQSIRKQLSDLRLPKELDENLQDGSLTEKRKNNFQFKGEIENGAPQGEIFNELKTVADKKEIDLAHFRIGARSTANVEIHLPIHKIYCGLFEQLFDSIASGAGADEAQVTFINFPTNRRKRREGKRAAVHRNCIIIRNRGQPLPEEEIIGRDPAPIVNGFASANFGSFGRYYLGKSPNGTDPCQIFDCTFSPATEVKVENAFSESSNIQNQLKNPDGYVTYYLFVFSCWRPQ